MTSFTFRNSCWLISASNSGGVSSGIPKPKYADADKTEILRSTKKQVNEYLAALKKFIQAHPETVSGVELELEGVNPQRKWAAIQNERRKRVQRAAPDIAQTKFLAARADTDWTGEVRSQASRRAITGSARSTWMPPPRHAVALGCAGGDSAGQDDASRTVELELHRRARQQSLVQLSSTTMGTPLQWLAFNVFVLITIVLDLRVFHRKRTR